MNKATACEEMILYERQALNQPAVSPNNSSNRPGQPPAQQQSIAALEEFKIAVLSYIRDTTLVKRGDPA